MVERKDRWKAELWVMMKVGRKVVKWVGTTVDSWAECLGGKLADKSVEM